MTPFDSSTFFTDPFFTTQSAGEASTCVYAQFGSSSATLPAIYRHGLDPVRDGPLMRVPGYWAEIVVLVADFRAAFGATSEPQSQDTITIDNGLYRVQQHGRDGDTFTIKAVKDQRKAR